MTRALATKPAATTAIAQYVKVDMAFLRAKKEEVKKEEAERNKRNGEYRMSEGKNHLRFLPPIDPTYPSPFREVWLHYIRNPDKPDDAARPVVCPAKTNPTGKGKCVVCAKANELRRSNNAVDQATGKELRSSRRYYANVIDMADVPAGVQYMGFGILIWKGLTDLLEGDVDNPDFPGVDYVDPNIGRVIMIEKSVGDKNNLKETTRYSTPKPSTRPTPVPVQDWLKGCFSLSQIIEPMDDENLRSLLEGSDLDADTAMQPAQGKPAGVAEAEFSISDDIAEDF